MDNGGAKQFFVGVASAPCLHNNSDVAFYSVDLSQAQFLRKLLVCKNRQELTVVHESIIFHTFGNLYKVSLFPYCMYSKTDNRFEYVQYLQYNTYWGGIHKQSLESTPSRL